MKSGSIEPNNSPLMRFMRLRDCTSFNAKMDIRIGKKAPARVFSMGADETICYRNISVKLLKDEEDDSPFSIMLSSKDNFKKLASAMTGIPMAYVYAPNGNYFVFSPWDFNISHTDLSRSLLVNLMPFQDHKADGVFKRTIGQAALLKGAFIFNEELQPHRFSTIITDMNKNMRPIEEQLMVMQSYLRLAITLRSFGCPASMAVKDYVPRAGMSRYHKFLALKNLGTLGEIIDNLEQMV